jgi:hypothetical protein
MSATKKSLEDAIDSFAERAFQIKNQRDLLLECLKQVTGELEAVWSDGNDGPIDPNPYVEAARKLIEEIEK